MVRFFAGDPEFDAEANEYRAMSLDPSGDSVPVLQFPKRSIHPRASHPGVSRKSPLETGNMGDTMLKKGVLASIGVRGL